MSKQPLPTPTEAMIRARTDERGWARGLSYVSHVEHVVWRDGTLTASVQGTDYAPYQVQVLFQGPEIVSATCSCPANLGGDCKHIVAVLYYLRDHAAEIEQRPALETVLRNLDRDQLAATLMTLASSHPQLLDEIETLLLEKQLTTGSPAPAEPAVTSQELQLFRRQIVADLRSAVKTGYDSWGDEAWYESDLGEALQPAVARARTLLAADDPQGALDLLETAFDAWQEGSNALDEYIGEAFEEQADEFTVDLADCWAEALLMLDLTDEERAAWQAELEELAATTFGGESLLIAATAADHGWDYPPLREAMQGNITEKGAWEGQPPWFADRLAQIRLRVLEQRGDYQAYLNLAQAEGEFLSYLLMLAKQGQSDLALAEALAHLDSATHVQKVAGALYEHGAPAQAFALAQHGLGLANGYGKAKLAAWLRDAAHARGDSALALQAGLRVLAEQATLADYLAVEEVAGPQWPAHRQEALAAVAQDPSTDGKVDIYLHERMYDRVIAAVDRAPYFSSIDKVLEAVGAHYPDWAFSQCARRAERIMDAGKAKEYDVAAAWLGRGRDILRAAGNQAMWTDYLDGAQQTHQRKYKLVPLLRALR